MIDPKFYIARRDTRWDVYPSREPEKAIAFDWKGFWEQYEPGLWFYNPYTSYNLCREISEEEAVSFAAAEVR